MTNVTEVVLPEIPVMYVGADKARPIAEQAPVAFSLLEAGLPSLKGRKFYGVVIDAEYRACVAITPDDDPAGLPHRRWLIPGGKYARTKILDWESRTHEIGPAFDAMSRALNIDPGRPRIEFYRGRKQLFLLAPVR